jgi:hypothetical protein
MDIRAERRQQQNPGPIGGPVEHDMQTPLRADLEQTFIVAHRDYPKTLA